MLITTTPAAGRQRPRHCRPGRHGDHCGGDRTGRRKRLRSDQWGEACLGGGSWSDSCRGPVGLVLCSGGSTASAMHDQYFRHGVD